MQPTTYLCLYVLYGNESKVYMPHTPIIYLYMHTVQ